MMEKKNQFTLLNHDINLTCFKSSIDNKIEKRIGAF